MQTFIVALQVVIALSIFNVWILRRNIPTRWRGGSARTLEEEFAEYGLSPWLMKCVGAAKLSLAVALLVGLQYRPLVAPAATLLAMMMLAAVVMHVRVSDPWLRSVPALTLLVLSAIVAGGA
jgi:uncharacterized membrane protein YphA (DoxX/SURF4 family)